VAHVVFQVGALTVSMRGAEARYLGELVRQQFEGETRASAAKSFAWRIGTLTESGALDELYDLGGEERLLVGAALDHVHLARPFMLPASLRALREALRAQV
jgi:hypothetical protein